jgi:hypothetical protein
MNKGVALTLAFGTILVGALLLTSGIRNRALGEVLKGETEARAATSSPEATAPAPSSGKPAPAPKVAGVASRHSVVAPGSGFVAAPTANYSKVNQSLITRLGNVARHLGLVLKGISGYRTPSHSVAVGGFANDPHTRGEASDTEGAQYIPKAVLNAFGLERPFPGSAEADHIQLLHSVNANGGY